MKYTFFLLVLTCSLNINVAAQASLEIGSSLYNVSDEGGEYYFSQVRLTTDLNNWYTGTEVTWDQDNILWTVPLGYSYHSNLLHATVGVNTEINADRKAQGASLTAIELADGLNGTTTVYSGVHVEPFARLALDMVKGESSRVRVWGLSKFSGVEFNKEENSASLSFENLFLGTSLVFDF